MDDEPIELSPAEWQALRVAAKPADKHRDRLEAGSHAVDLALRLSGVLVVAADSQATCKDSVPAQLLLAWVLAELGPKTRDKVLSAVKGHARTFTAGELPPAAPADALVAAEDLVEATTRPKQVERRGNVVGSLTLKRVKLTAAHLKAA